MSAHVAAGPTILLVETESVFRADVACCLSQAGFSIIEAGNTAEAWETLERQPDVRVVFADLDASDSAEGLELVRRVHARWPTIGLVIVSGHIRRLCPAEVPGNGCFLPRPLPAEILLQEIRSAAFQISKD